MKPFELFKTVALFALFLYSNLCWKCQLEEPTCNLSGMMQIFRPAVFCSCKRFLISMGGLL